MIQITYCGMHHRIYIYLIRRLTSQYGWVFLRVGSILGVYCFLLPFTPLFFFIHTKIARFCLICWNLLRCFQPRPQGLLGIFQNGGCGVTRHFEKYPEGPGDEVGVVSILVENRFVHSWLWLAAVVRARRLIFPPFSNARAHICLSVLLMKWTIQLNCVW